MAAKLPLNYRATQGKIYLAPIIEATLSRAHITELEVKALVGIMNQEPMKRITEFAGEPVILLLKLRIKVCDHH
jgi:hypothetical protein